MKRVLTVVCVLMLAAVPAVAEEKIELKTDVQKLSYALGMDLGSYFKTLGEDLDLTVIQKGIADSYNGKDVLMTPEDAAAVQKQFAANQQKKQIEKMQEMTATNKKAAEKFLAENKGKEGVKTTDSGLQYKVVKQGEGAVPKAGDTVKVHYKGTLLDGTEFDSSYKRNEPAEFNVNQVIPGWTEALLLMKEGTTCQLFLAPELAYGDRGAPPVIEPGSMLLFEVELIEIVKAEEEIPAAEKDTKAKK